MKKLSKLIYYALFLILSISCASDDEITTNNSSSPVITNDNDDSRFALLPTNQNEFLNYPIESSPEQPILGQWKLIKIDLYLRNFSVETLSDNDPDDFECGQTHLQFNSENLCIQNVFKKTSKICKVYSGKYSWYTDQNILSITNEVTSEILKVDKITTSDLIVIKELDPNEWGYIKAVYFFKKIKA
ncbi:hypothetical protein LZZ90_13445 [Flavobacterium sp. SM15]|uniref:hypothetical protein n=1 Tax=Flavobacterium sp. SM15 TaxID=2908005 RepID=UPI001EDC789E|nr:hypothetical protein [Flavobacterium sp. SM15]MCG2612514.1 hypothetical protein [Flavobacterium sp. SM15]